MNFQPTELQVAVADLAAKLVVEFSQPSQRADWIGAAAAYDPALHAAFAENGLYGTCIAEELGGSGLGFLEACSILVVLGAEDARVPFMASTVLAALPLDRFGVSPSHRDLVKCIVAGKLIGTAALAEPGGANSRRLATVAKRDGDGFRLSGVKTSVPSGMQADVLLVPAVLEDGATAVFLLDPAMPGLSREPQTAVDWSTEALLRLDEVRVGSGGMLGTPDEAGQVHEWLTQRARIAVAACQLGAAQAALTITAEWVNQREQFGRTLSSSPVVALRAADLHILIEAARLTMWHAADLLAAGQPAHAQVSTAKYWASELGNLTALIAHRLQGGIGVDMQSRLPWLTLKQRQYEFQFGSARQQLCEAGARLAAA